MIRRSITHSTAIIFQFACILTASICDILPSSYDPALYFARQNPANEVWRRSLDTYSYIDTMLNARVTFDQDYTPGYTDYPRFTSMMAGICDTLTIKVQIINQSAREFALSGNNPYDWFKPSLYRPTMSIVGSVPAVDAKDLGYAPNLCPNLIDPANPPDTIHANTQNGVLAYNVWNIPEGVWVLTLDSTDKTPSYVNLVHDGGLFEYRHAKDGQDTVNAWLAISSRAMGCSDASDAQSIIEKAISFYPKSVPAWWSIANFFAWSGDSVLCFQAFDSAYKFLNEKLDPLLPDTTNSVQLVEREFMRAAKPLMEFDRQSARKYGFW